jgi:starch synthase
MKIAIITLVNRGGMIHYTSQLANALSLYGTVTVIIGNIEKNNYFNDNIIVKSVPLPSSRIFAVKNFLNFLSVIKILRNINPDIIHISGNHFWIFGLYNYLKNKNVVLTLHDVNEHEGEKSLINIITNNLHIKLAKHIFVHGEKLRKILISKGYPENDISVIKHGDYSFFTEYEKDISEDGSILFFGRLVDYKGIQYLIESVPHIKKQINNINVIIAGKGNFDKYSYLIKNPENFEIINEFIPDMRVAELFRRASVIVLPYIEGSQTGIIPIAYSFRKPVVVTNVGSIQEVVEEGVTGFIVPPRDSYSLANAIIKLLKDEDLRKKMGDYAFRKMKDELSWNGIAEKIFEKYKTVSNKK